MKNKKILKSKLFVRFLFGVFKIGTPYRLAAPRPERPSALWGPIPPLWPVKMKGSKVKDGVLANDADKIGVSIIEGETPSWWVEKYVFRD